MIQANGTRMNVCVYDIAAIPKKDVHIHRSNGILFIFQREEVWATCLSEVCHLGLARNWLGFMRQRRSLMSSLSLDEQRLKIRRHDDKDFLESIKQSENKKVWVRLYKEDFDK